MGRPRKGAGVKAADERMVEAFWNQLASTPYSEITATSIAQQVSCNRATFYYYFDSIDDLANYAVETSVPFEILHLVEGFLSGKLTSLHLDDRTRQAVERLCRLAGTDGCAMLLGRLTSSLEQAWTNHFDLDTSRDDVQAVITFMASGIVGVLGHWAGKPCNEEFDNYLQTISRVFSAPAIEFAGQARVAKPSH